MTHPLFVLFRQRPSQQDRIERLLGETIIKLDILIRLETKMSAATDRIVASVATITTKADSLIELVTRIAQELRDANTNDDPAISALADQLDAESSKIAAAVDANTPADPNA